MFQCQSAKLTLELSGVPVASKAGEFLTFIALSRTKKSPKTVLSSNAHLNVLEKRAYSQCWQSDKDDGK